MTTELDFNFDVPEIKSTAQKQLEKDAKKLAKAEAIATKRYRCRGERKQELAEANFRRSALGKLTRVWSENFAALSPEEQSRINAEHTLAVGFLWDIEDTIRGIQQNKIAGESMLHPDILYKELQDYLRQFPAIHRWAPPATAALLDKEDFDSLDDTAFRETGIVTRVPRFIVKHCEVWLKNWAKKHRDDCEKEVLNQLGIVNELEAPAPVASAKPTGYQPMTKQEEEGMFAHKQHVAKIQAELQKREIEAIRGDANVHL